MKYPFVDDLLSVETKPWQEGTLGTQLGGPQEEDNPHSLHCNNDAYLSATLKDLGVEKNRKVVDIAKKRWKKKKVIRDSTLVELINDDYNLLSDIMDEVADETH